MSSVYPPPAPGPGPSMMDYVKSFLGGGLTGAAQTGGMQMPGWSNAIGNFLQKPEVNAALGVMSPIKGATMASASRALPLTNAGGAPMRPAANIHPDIKSSLIDSLYGDAAAGRDASQMSAIAKDVYKAEKEHGITLVKDPAERKRMGLPAIEPSVSQNPLDFSSLKTKAGK